MRIRTNQITINLTNAELNQLKKINKIHFGVLCSATVVRVLLNESIRKYETK